MDDAMDAQDAERYVFSKYMVLRERLPGEEVRFMERAVNITVAKVARIFECRNCGRCCDEKYGVMLNRLDIARMSEALGISQNKFVEMFVVEVDGVPHIAVSKMCSFREGGLCKLYAHRPQACKDYPVKSLLTRAALFVALYDGCLLLLRGALLPPSVALAWLSLPRSSLQQTHPDHFFLALE